MSISIKSGGSLNILSGGSAIINYSAPPAFSPSSLGGLKAWYKADGITGLSDGSPVPLWNDSSDHGNTALLYTGYGDNEDFRLIGPDSDSPSWVQSDANFNGKPSVHFKGKGYGAYNSGHKFSSKGGSYPTSGGFTMYFVGRIDAAAQDNSASHMNMAAVRARDTANFGVPPNGQQDRMPYFRYNTANPGWGNPSTSVSCGNDYAGYSENLAGPGVTAILSYCYATNDNFRDNLLYINGSHSGISQTGSWSFDKIVLPINDIYIGGHENVPFAGNIAEFIVYEGKHSDADRAAITAYFAAKYGISI